MTARSPVIFGHRTESPGGITTRKDAGDCSGSGEVDSAARNIHTLLVLSLRPVVYPHTSSSGDVSTAERPLYAEGNSDTKLDGEPTTRSFSLDISPSPRLD